MKKNIKSMKKNLNYQFYAIIYSLLYTFLFSN